jgi:glycosyltransferase involved in cell wall biosynthesis
MRIGLFIDTDNYGGAEAIVTSLATYLRERGHELTLYHFGNPYLERLATEKGLRARRVGHHHEYKRTARLPWFARHFARQLVADEIDLLHSHLFGPIAAGGVACRMAGIPHVGTLHDVYIVQERPIRALLLRIVYWLGTELVCVSERMAEYYSQSAGIPLRRLRVIRNGVDLAVYGASQRVRAPGELVRLIMVGRLDAIKRHDLWLRVLARLHGEARWHAQVVGDGPQKDSLLALRHALGLDERVAFLGQRGDVAALLAAADVFLLVSDSEGMSLSLVEAVASGLPAIVTDVGNNAELVRHRWNGFVVQPGDAEAIEAALRTLIADGDLRKRFGDNARSLSGERLDSSRALAAYLGLYGEIAAGRARQNSV